MWSLKITVFLIFQVKVYAYSVENHQKTVISIKDGIQSQQKSSNDDELVFAHVLFRHGDRNVGWRFPNDPFKDEINWPDGGYGALTKTGKKQLFALGQYLRRRYGKLIGNKYSPQKVYVRSSDHDRVLMSAAACLAGLFPPTDNEIWHDEIQWQPIPIHSVPNNMDYLLHHGKKCLKYKNAYEKYLQESMEIRQMYTQNAKLLTYWSEQCGSNITTPREVLILYKTIFMEKLHNKTLSDWAKQAIEPNGTLENMASHYFKTRTATKQLARLRIGFLLREIFDRFTEKLNSKLKPDRSLWIYAAHDTTIANVLDALGLFEPHIPPYAASVHFELYKTGTNDHYVQLFYRKSGEETLSPMNIPDCGEKCTLNKLYELYDAIIPGDFDSECAL